MAERDDLAIDWAREIRLIWVSPPSQELTQQDLVDTLRSMTYGEGSWNGLDEPYLIDPSGKEELGGGQLVGITNTLRSGQIAFGPWTQSAEAGTATSADPTGYSLTDTAALFQTANIKPGDTIINLADGSVATVYSVVDETHILHTKLDDGSDNQWEIGDSYKIWPTIQCEISGGNVVATDVLGNDMSPVFPTAFTQIIKTSSSSATLQDLEAIQYASFGGGVSVDANSGRTGTAYPNGNKEYPVNNIPDAVTIAAEKGFDTLFIKGNYTFNTGDDISDFKVMGQNIIQSLFTINAGAICENSQISDCTLTGLLDGGTIVRNALASNLYYVNGYIIDCEVEGIFTILAGKAAQFIRCVSSGIPGISAPVIDLEYADQLVLINGFSGCGITIKNKTDDNPLVINALGATVKLEDTIMAGSIIISGMGHLNDLSGGTAVVNTEGFLDSELIAQGVWQDASALQLIADTAFIKHIEGGRWRITGNQMVFYEDDNTTEVARFDLYDKDGELTSDMAKAYERRRV